MKGKNKYIVPLLLAGMTTATGIVANVQQTTTVVADTEPVIENVVGKNVKIGGFSDKYSIGFIELPEVKFDDVVYTSDYSNIFTVTKGKRKVPVVKVDGKWGFNANLEGLYNVAVTAPNPDKDQVVSEITNLSVWVEKDDATINMPVNSSRVIPAKLPMGQKGFEIPAPTVTVMKGDKEVTKTALEIQNDNATDDDKLVVSLVTPSGTQPLSLPTEGEDRDYYKVSDTFLSSIGTYQILYEYYKGDTIISRLDSNFQVVSDDSFVDDINLTMSILDSIPATGTVNTDIKIPKIKVVESVGSVDAVNCYVEVTITNVTTGEVIPQSDIDYKNYTFKPTKKGSYLVSYLASIPLFDKETSPVSPNQMIEVTDNKAPTLRATYNYTVENGSITSVNGKNVTAVDGKTNNEVAAEMLVNRKCDIPSVAQLDKTTGTVQVTLPAVFAEDNMSEYKDIVFEREYRKPNGTVVKLDNEDYPVNQSATITLDAKGPYVIRYRAYDAENNKSGEIEQALYVYDKEGVTEEDFSKGKTDIDFYVSTTSITNKEGKIKFAKPSVSDTYDKDVDVKTYYDIYKSGTKTSSEIELTETNGNGEYEIDVKKLITDNPGITEIKLYAVAYLDATRPGVVSNKVESKVYSVSIINALSDAQSATISVDGYASWNEALFAFNSQEDPEGVTTNILSKDVAGTATKVNAAGYASVDGTNAITKEINGVDVKLALFDQGSSELHLPTVKFTDNLDENLRIKVSVKDTFGNTVPFTKEPKIRKDEHTNVYTVSDARFRLSSYDVYTVTYTAIDMNGNTTVQSYGIRVNDKTTPTIEVETQGVFGKDIEVGEFFSFPNATLKKGGRNVDAKSIIWDIYKKSDNAEYYKTNNGFIPETEGTYYISCTAIDTDGNIVTLKDETFKVKAVKSEKPQIKLDLNYYLPENVEWDAISEEEDYMLIDIPRAYPVDTDLEVVYTITGPNGNDIKVKDFLETDAKYDHRRYFKAEKEGVYKIVYSISDGLGNTSTIEEKIAIGDCVKPQIKNLDLPTTFNLNDTFKLNLEEANAELWDDQTPESEIEVDAQMYYKDTTKVETTGVDGEWKLDKVGSYVLKITLKDKAGNTETKSYNIEVKAEEADSKEISPVLGTVLIVLSVVVLAGIVVYFVVSSKKKNNKPTAKKTKNK